MLQYKPHTLTPLYQTVSLDDLLYSQRSRATDRMRLISLSVIEASRPGSQHINNLFTNQNTSDRSIPTTEALAHRHDVRHYAFTLMLECKKRARTPHSAHDFVQDQQDTMSVANISYSTEITRRSRHTSSGSANNRFSNESNNILRTQPFELRIQLISKTGNILNICLPIKFILIRIRRRNMAHILQKQRLIRHLPWQI